MSETDYLTTDPEISGQKYVCLSFLTSRTEEDVEQNKPIMGLSGIKVRGVFDDYDAACKRASMLRDMDSSFHVFVGEVGKWLPYDPNPDSKYVKNSEYAHPELNNMMKAHITNQEQANIESERRKIEKMKQNITSNLTTLKKQHEEAQVKCRKAQGSMKVTWEKRIETMKKRIADSEEKIKGFDAKDAEYKQKVEALNQNKDKQPDVAIPTAVQESLTTSKVVEATEDGGAVESKGE